MKIQATIIMFALTGCCATCIPSRTKYTPEQFALFEKRAEIGAQRADIASACYEGRQYALYGDDHFANRLDELLYNTGSRNMEACLGIANKTLPMPPVPKQWEREYQHYTTISFNVLDHDKARQQCLPAVDFAACMRNLRNQAMRAKYAK